MKILRYIMENWQLRPLTALAIGSGIGAAVGLNALPWWSIGAVLVFLLGLSLCGKILLILGVIIAGISGAYQLHKNCALEAKLPAHPFWAEGSFLCTDTRLSKLPGLEMPKQQRGLLTLPETGTIPVTATFPAETQRPFFGDEFSVTGQFYPPSPSALIVDAGGKITGNTEPPFGKTYRMRVKSAKFERSCGSFRRALLLWRDVLLKRLLAHLDDNMMRSQTARLFLGASAGAPAETRNRYVSAGTIHLFAVSGMHVAVLAGLLLFLLRPFPFRLRYCAVSALVWLYVICTGCAYSAIRAGAMISVWALCRAMLLYFPGWNVLCLGWSLILWCDPQAVTELGVQYSFAITAALILGAERFRDLRRSGTWQLQLMTEHNAETTRFHRHLRRAANLLALPFSAGIAFAASSGISLYAQSLFAPGGIAANFLLPLLTPLLFIAMVGKMLLGWIAPVLDRIGAALIALAFSALDQLCKIVVSLFDRVGAVQPALWEVALFYAAFFFALGSRRFRPALCGGMIALALLLSWPVRGTLRESQLWVLSSGCSHPAMIVHIPRGSECAQIFNVPDFNCGITASRELRKTGVTQAEVWLVSGTTAAGGGLAALRSGGMRIVKLHLPAKTSPAFQAIVTKSEPEQIADARFSSFAGVSGLTISDQTADDGRRVRITTIDGNAQSATIPWSNPPVWYIMEREKGK